MESQPSQDEPTPNRLPFFAFAGHRWVTARHLETATATVTAIATTANQTSPAPSLPPLSQIQSTEGATTTTSASEGGNDKEKSPASTSAPSSSSSGPLPQSRDDVTAARATGAPLPPLLFNTLHLISWNIDFSTPEDEARMAAALNHLHSLVETIDSAGAVVIFLQENKTTDLELISAAEWVRNRFYITDLRIDGYGTTALVDRRLVIGGDGVQRQRLVSRYGRDGLLIDLAVRSVGGDGDGDGQHKVLRLCNVHLESLGHIPPVRPVQFAALAPLLEPSRPVHGSIMAGDMNAIRPYDETLPAEHGLSDAYLALGGVEGAAEGNTWGYQSGRTRFSPGRLDKVLFAGGVTPRSLERIGVGVVVEDGGALHRLREMGAQEFATDHYGLWAEFALDGVALVGGQDVWRACCAPDGCDCASQPVARPAVYNLWKLGSSTT